jgi:hypothetical protein
MDSEIRQKFREVYSDALYRRYVEEISGRLGVTFSFRHAETPVFLPRRLRDRMTTTAEAILDQLLDPARIERMKAYIPDRWNTPGLAEYPSFTMIDLAIVRDADGELVPRLIELQGFPSLTALQVYKRDVWSELLCTLPGLEANWSCWFSGLDRDGYLQLARQTIVSDHDPDEVILMDLDPPTQGTYPDFVATKALFGVTPVCPSALVKQGKHLFRRSDDGRKLIPVRRIYHRVVFDELERSPLKLPFDFTESLEVEWAGHPNWFFIWSKASMPFLDHPDVPKAILVSELTETPDLSRYVLKPLFSFSGGGVNMSPTREDLDKIPPDQKANWCLQEKVEYAPAVLTPQGEGVKAEIRMMFLKAPGMTRPRLAVNLARLARGLLVGTAYNRDFTWVGSTVALWPAT